MKKFGDKLPEAGIGPLVDKLQKDKKLRPQKALDMYSGIASHYDEFSQEPLGFIQRLGEAKEGFLVGPSGTALALTGAKPACADELNIERFTYQSATILDAVMGIFIVPKKKALGALLMAYAAGLVIYKNAPCAPSKAIFDDFESGAFQMTRLSFDKAAGASGTAQVVPVAGGHCLQVSGTVKGWGLFVNISSGYARRRLDQASELSLKVRSDGPATLHVRINDSKFVDASGYWETKVPFELKPSPGFQSFRVKAEDLLAKDKPIPLTEAMRSTAEVVLWIEKAEAKRVLLDVDDIQIR